MHEKEHEHIYLWTSMSVGVERVKMLLQDTSVQLSPYNIRDGSGITSSKVGTAGDTPKCNKRKIKLLRRKTRQHYCKW